MFAWATPDASDDEHERLLAIEEGIVGALGLPYRVVNIAAGDLGAAATKKYDLEVWLPSEERYRELTSCSNYRDFSARRLDARVKTSSGSQFVHTLNGTACAVGRTLVFLWELYQEDGGVRRPRRAAPDHRLRPGRTHVASPLGGVPERPNGTALKAVEAQASVGSNPTPSA